MSDLPWYMNLFNMELLEQKKKQWKEEAKAKGMSLHEYLEYLEKKNNNYSTCKHYPNDEHCRGCQYDLNLKGNTKYERGGI